MYRIVQALGKIVLGPENSAILFNVKAPDDSTRTVRVFRIYHLPVCEDGGQEQEDEHKQKHEHEKGGKEEQGEEEGGAGGGGGGEGGKEQVGRGHSRSTR